MGLCCSLYYWISQYLQHCFDWIPQHLQHCPHWIPQHLQHRFDWISQHLQHCFDWISQHLQHWISLHLQGCPLQQSSSSSTQSCLRTRCSKGISLLENNPSSKTDFFPTRTSVTKRKYLIIVCSFLPNKHLIY